MKLEFNLEKQAAKVAHINVREEMHGDDPILALDVRVETNVPNDFLSYLSPTLKWSLYDKADGQGELIKDDAHLPALRHAELGVLGWAGEMEGASVVFHGLKKSGDIAIEGSVDKVRFECKEGGTVALTFRVKVMPTPAQSAALMGLLGHDAKVSVRPPGEE